MRPLSFFMTFAVCTGLSALPPAALAQTSVAPGAPVAAKPQTLDDMFIELRKAKSSACRRRRCRSHQGTLVAFRQRDG